MSDDEYVRPKVWYVIYCRVCDEQGGMPIPIPFGHPANRGKWAAAHKAGTGHDRWHVVDEPA